MKRLLLASIFLGLSLSNCGGGSSSSTPPSPTLQAPAITNGSGATFTEGRAGSFTVTATGVPTPTITESGGLPGGVTFSANVLSGTPIAIGSFSIVFTASNGVSPSATQNFTLTVNPFSSLLDIYGGVLAAPSPNGSTGYFRTEKSGNRWFLVTPAGNYYFGLGVYSIFPDTTVWPSGGGTSQGSSMITKYGDDTSSGIPAELERILSWGFNATGPYSSSWAMPSQTYVQWPGDHSQPVKVPTIGYLKVGYYSLFNQTNYAPQAVPDLIYGVAPGAHMAYRGDPLPDVFSPYFEQYTSGYVNAIMVPPSASNSQYYIGYMSDDPGYMWGFSAGSYPSVLAGHTNDRLGYTTLITAPTQSSNTNCGLRSPANPCTYPDTQVYSKTALATYLQTKYGTIAVLNAAWSVNGVPATYTSFGSDGGWGIGTGLLDENGIMGHAWVGRNGQTLADFPATVAADLKGFDVVFSAKYFSICKKYFNAHWPQGLYFGLMAVGSWNQIPNAEVLQGMAGNVDYLSLQVDPTSSSFSAEMAVLYQNVGDVPLLNNSYLYADADSPFSSCAGATGYATQELRGQAYHTWLNDMWTATYPNGSAPFNFMLWWQLADKPTECHNEGLVSPYDNAYDGTQDQISVSTDSACYMNYSTNPPTSLCNVQRGGEANNYGDAITTITKANQGILNSVAGLP
jgi:hypothetical protein